MCKLFHKIEDLLAPLKLWSDRQLLPIALLVLRLTVAQVFFISGKLKFGYVLNDQLDTLYFLFEDYNVPFLPVKVAAWMGMAGELGFSILLGLGLFARLGAIGLIFMSAVIYNTDHNQMALYWVVICFAIAVMGAGKYSADTLIWKRKD